MTMSPDTGQPDGVSGQLLVKISSDVSSLVTDVAVIKSQMGSVSDHETRIRNLESSASQVLGAKDTQARVTSWLAAAAAVGAGIAGYLHH